MLRTFLICIFISFSFIANLVLAKDVANQELYWKQQLSTSVKVGEVVDLKTADKSFLAIYHKQGLFEEKGSVILMHDKGGHPNWKDVIRPLRIHLAETGWNTLSIQMPLRTTLSTTILTKVDELQAFHKLGYQRIEQAATFLKEKTKSKTYILAYGTNGQTLLNYIKEKDNASIKGAGSQSSGFDGLILISLPSVTIKEHPNNMIELLEKVKLPILDIFGSEDLSMVVKTAEQRQAAAKRAGNFQYLQQQINSSDHFFKNQTKTLIKRIHSWMLSINKE